MANQGGAGGNHILRNVDCKRQLWGVAIKGVLNAKNSIDQCTIPEQTNEYLVKANKGVPDVMRTHGASSAAGFEAL